MIEMIVLVFDDEEGALQMRDRLLAVRKQRLLQLADAAVAIRQQDGKVKVKQLNDLVGTSAFGGAFWGLLIGLLLAVPGLGLVAGAAAGAVIGKLADYGVDDKFIKEVGESIEPGQSALFLMVHTENLAKLSDQFSEFNPTILQTTLSDEAEAHLRESFGTDEIEA
jgi:uncharacterized membrane protein